MSSKRFAGGVIWSCGALGFNETCFGFSVFAGGVLQSRDPLNLPKKRERRALFLIMQWKAAGVTVISIFFFWSHYVDFSQRKFSQKMLHDSRLRV